MTDFTILKNNMAQGLTLQQLQDMGAKPAIDTSGGGLTLAQILAKQTGQLVIPNPTQQTPESQGAVKQPNGTYRGATLLEGLGEAAKGAANFVGSQAIGAGQALLKAGQQRSTAATRAMNIDTDKNNAQSNAAIQTGEDLKKQMQPQNQAQQGGATAANVGEIALPLAEPIAGAIENAPEVLKGAKGLFNAGKELISPSLTSEEQVGKIIQGKLGDIPAAQRTLNALPSDINPAKMDPKELATAIQDNVIQKNLNEVDTHFANDNSLHPMSEFTQTVGKGASEVKTNYVQQAIDQLKEFYTKTNDAQGLSDIQALEAKATSKGLSSQELNNLAKEHGATINAFNANGEAASGLSKQAAENTRSGVKTTARDMLAKSDPQAAAEATRLDKETADAIKTKNLLDKQVEKGNTSIQKKGKPNAISKVIKAHPVASKVVGKGLKIAAGAALGKTVGGTTGEVIGGVVGGGL